MVYCISDIHGEYDRYKAMLDLIQFSDEDTLYILGDVIDRGPNGVDILLDIMNRNNIHMILGNHEAMCIATIGPHNEIGARELWERNGGDCTRADLIYCRHPSTRDKIVSYLLTLPDHLNIIVNGKPFHLVHGYPAFDQFHRIWSRPATREAQAPIPGITVIVGHTPTPLLTGDYDNPCSIWHGNGIIDIDCGCGHNWLDSRLACLRLDDMAEYYV